jgi:hypothetical protein
MQITNDIYSTHTNHTHTHINPYISLFIHMLTLSLSLTHCVPEYSKILTHFVAWVSRKNNNNKKWDTQNLLAHEKNRNLFRNMKCSPKIEILKNEMLLMLCILLVVASCHSAFQPLNQWTVVCVCGDKYRDSKRAWKRVFFVVREVPDSRYFSLYNRLVINRLCLNHFLSWFFISMWKKGNSIRTRWASDVLWMKCSYYRYAKTTSNVVCPFMSKSILPVHQFLCDIFISVICRATTFILHHLHTLWWLHILQCTN